MANLRTLCSISSFKFYHYFNMEDWPSIATKGLLPLSKLPCLPGANSTRLHEDKYVYFTNVNYYDIAKVPDFMWRSRKLDLPHHMRCYGGGAGRVVISRHCGITMKLDTYVSRFSEISFKLDHTYEKVYSHGQWFKTEDHIGPKRWVVVERFDLATRRWVEAKSP